MSLVTLNQLVSPVTATDALTIELAIAQGLNLPTTSWQPLGMARTILAINSNVVAQYGTIVNLLAQGGYASYAALMVDANGTPITTWMDLIASNNYNILRVPVSYASGPVPVSNSTATPYTYTVGQLHFQNTATRATYTNTASGTVAASGASTIQVQADAAWGGTIGTTGAGVTLAMLTPLPGVTPQAQASSLVGANAESNGALLTRGQSKLGTLSSIQQIPTSTPPPAAPGGAPGAYDFVARSIPQAGSSSTVYPYTVTSPITRTSVAGINGFLTIFVANAAGGPITSDVNAVNAAIQALCVPQGVRALVLGAVNLAVNITYTVYVRAAGALPTMTILANVAGALATYFASIPISGATGASTGIVPLAELTETIMTAANGVDLTYVTPTASVPVLVGQVPVPGTIVGSVVLV
jgi:hypothetical protein